MLDDHCDKLQRSSVATLQRAPNDTFSGYLQTSRTWVTCTTVANVTVLEHAVLESVSG